MRNTHPVAVACIPGLEWHNRQSLGLLVRVVVAEADRSTRVAAKVEPDWQNAGSDSTGCFCLNYSAGRDSERR